jgi:hypothetical protein
MENSNNHNGGPIIVAFGDGNQVAYSITNTYQGNVNNGKNESARSSEKDTAKKKASPDQIMKALDLSKAYIWGNAAYTVAFCVVRDDYKNGENVSSFERLLNEKGEDDGVQDC